MIERLSGRVALVTGAASGIGRATTIRLASEGAHVFATDLDVGAARALADQLRSLTLNVDAMAHDVSSETDWDAARVAIEAHSGHLDILVNNAGVGDFRTLEEETLADFERTTGIGMTGLFLGLRAMSALLKKSRCGSVITIGSIYALRGGVGSGAAYHAAKGAVRTLTLNTAVHWAPDGVRVNVIHPGFVNTELLRPAIGTALEEQLVAQVPLGRLGRPHEIAAAVAFLASDDASFITGSELAVDGGFLAR